LLSTWRNFELPRILMWGRIGIQPLTTPMFNLLTIILLFSLAGRLMDFSHILTLSQRVTVGNIVVEEKIYRDTAFPDPA